MTKLADSVQIILRLLPWAFRSSAMMDFPARSRIRFIVALAFLVAIDGCTPSESWREQILRATPKGCSYSAVLAFCENKGLPCKHSNSAGFLNQDSGQAVGVASIWATVDPGKVRNVEAFWGFGRDGKLLDVWVRTTYEGV